MGNKRRMLWELDVGTFSECAHVKQSTILEAKAETFIGCYYNTNWYQNSVKLLDRGNLPFS